MSERSWLTSIRYLFSRQVAAGSPSRRRQRTGRYNPSAEPLEERRLLAFDFVAAYAESDIPFFVSGHSAATTLSSAPQQITLRFSPGVKISPAALGGISLVGSGGGGDGFGLAGTKADTQPIVPGSITVNDLPDQNEVVIRFAETLPDDTYRITIAGGISGLKTTTGDTMAATRSFDFRLDLGSMVVSVVPQPVSRSGAGLSQDRNSIVVYFNRNDPLSKASAETASLYRLYQVDANGDDVAAVVPDTPNWVEPTTVAYNATAGTATLTFANIVNDKLHRLQIGGAPGVVAATATVTEGSDDNSSFTTARQLGTLNAAGLVVTGSISARPTVMTPAGTLALPTQNGAIDSPGHRDIPINGTAHGNPTVVIGDGGSIDPVYYNFKSNYGQFNGVPLQNAITETQKQRAREIMELFGRYTGLRFIESDTAGFTVATGDIRVLDPMAPPQGVAGMADGGPVGGKAVMNASLDWGQSEYGGYWFKVAMHEIGHVLGLQHSYDLPTIMGKGLPGEAIFPTDYDIEELRQYFPANGSDVDVYAFTLADAGKLTAETVIARPGQPLYHSSKLDSLLTIYRQDPTTGRREMVARNDDSFGRDSFIGLDLTAGTYFLAVSSTGNDGFNPEASDSGDGGRSDGDYQLKLGFQPASASANTLVDTTGTPLDGDRDGEPGGIFNFWFNTASPDNTIYVDKVAATRSAATTLNSTAVTVSPTGLVAGMLVKGTGIAEGTRVNAVTGTGVTLSRAATMTSASVSLVFSNGTAAFPFVEIDDALAAVTVATKIIRIIGNNQNRPYLVGTTLAGQPLADGATFNVPKGVTAMIDAGALFKLRAANIDVGSSSPLVNRSGAAIQVLGTPEKNVLFTSYHDDSIGGNSDGVGPPGFDGTQGKGNAGQWGGIVLRQDSDASSKKAFVNTISQATINFGGGQVRVDSQLDSFAPITLQTTRPTLVFNTIQRSAGAAISANPDSFEESNGRVGPELRGNRLLSNTINGLFLKVRTALGSQPDRLDVPARLRSTDIVYVLQDNLLIDGGVGGYQRVGGVDRARSSGRLTIDPGVVVKLQGARIELERGTSQLIAEGTAWQKVIFTSLGDNRFGAGGTFDTNGNLPDVRTAGDWGGIVVNAGGEASIDHAYLGYGGGQTPIEGSFDNFNVIEVHQGDLRLAHSRIENNASGAAVGTRNARGGNAAATIFVRGAQPAILGNDFRDNRGAIVSVNVNALADALRPDPGRSSGPLDRDIRYDDNRGPLVRDNLISYTIDAAAGRPAAGAIGGMEVRGEEIAVESVWDDVDIVHVLKSEIIVQNLHTYTGVRLMSQTNASLVVKLLGANAGFTAAGYGLDIDDRIGGTVQVIGQPGYPVVLTSLSDDTVGASVDPLGRTVKDTNNDGSATSPLAGDWRSLQFLPMSNDRNVAIIQEEEKASTQGIDVNPIPGTAQVLGTLAPNFATGSNTFESAQEKSGDDVRRLGFEVHGFIATDDPTDVDVYAFTGYAGSEVWIDIDKTSPSLDTMVELLDAAGNVRARSADSQVDGALAANTKGIALPLNRDSWNGGDHYSVNPKDAGMRVVLPGDGQPNGTAIQYFIRVRSQPRYEPTTTPVNNGGVSATTQPSYENDLVDPDKVKSGATSGAYELRVRLRQLDEKPGSTVRYADIRYPTIGIDVQGLPRNSPLVGETGENAGGSNETFATAQYVGNLLQTDRNTISIAGTIANAGDVDWYTFALNYEQIQVIGGLSSGQKTWATVFDLDYGDGIRGDLTISVYDSQGRLLYIGRDSNVASDQPGPNQGADTDDLSRGTFGTLDPFIGPVQMPAGNPTGFADVESADDPKPPDPSKQLRFYVAVSSGGQLPIALNASFDGGSANTLVRLEPVDSVTRVVEDHIGFNGYSSGPGLTNATPVNPSTKAPLFDMQNLTAHVTPFTLSDVTLFVAQGESLGTFDAMTGNFETRILNNGSGGSDLFMRPDGNLYSYRGLANTANTAGALSIVNAGDGSLTLVGNDSIPDKPASTIQTDTDLVGAGSPATRFTLTKAGVNAAGVSGQLSYSGTFGGNAVTATWSFTSDASGILTFDEVGSSYPGSPFPMPSTGRVNDVTNQIEITGSPAFNASSAVITTVTYTFTGSTEALTTDSVDAMGWCFVGDKNELYYSVRDGASSRLYRANPANGSATFVAGQAWGRKGTVIDVGGTPDGPLGNVTGMAFVGATLYGVDSNGYFFTINTTTGAATIINQPAGAGVSFGGLTLGPQNLYGGTLANTLFAIDSLGVLRAFDTAGNLQTLFDAEINATGAIGFDGVADSTSISTGAFNATGLAFSPLDINLWHPTTRRGYDAGHGVNPAGDNTRDGAFLPNVYGPETYSESSGGASMYFGFEQYVETFAPYAVWGTVGQYGVNNASWQKSLSSNPELPNTYNMPGGAYGSLTTSSFSLAGATYADKPTLYFNYFLQSDPSASGDVFINFMRDSARVFISANGGAWELLATNNPATSPVDKDVNELPATQSASSDVSSLSNQAVQQLYRDAKWRQARIDLGKWHGVADLRLRIDFSTAGMFDPDQKDANGNLVNNIKDDVGNSFGDFSGTTRSKERGQNNKYEGFYVDDFIVGFAERGEMVTGAAAGMTDFFAPPQAEPSANVPAKNLQGSYQLEMRRGTEYGGLPSKLKSDVVISQTFDTNADLTRAKGFLGDANHPREQGQFIIEGNLVSNAKTYGISIDAGRDGATNQPYSGAVLNTAAPNSSRLVPGVVVINNVVAASGTAGILFSGDANIGAVPTAAVPFGRIVNNTIVGTVTPTGVGIDVNQNAGPTMLNNLFANLITGIQVDASSASNTVVGSSAYWNTAAQVVGIAQSQGLTLAADPFVNAATGNYYLRSGSEAIDSGINSLAERPAFTAVKSPLGIPDAPIIAPERDLYGQLRDDDPAQASDPGLGSNVFKDRGAIDRVDFTRPYAAIAVPLDGSSADKNLTADGIRLEKADARAISRFEIQLNDTGVGVDKTTVVSSAFEVRRDGTLLIPGADYTFNFLESSGRVVFESASLFPMGAYRISVQQALVNGVATNAITDRAGNPLLANQGDGTAFFDIELMDVPTTPAGLLATFGDKQAALTWTAANSDGTPLLRYEVQRDTSNAFGNPTTINVTNPVVASTVATGLTNGTAYYFRVRAVNVVGESGWSNIAGPIVPVPITILALGTGVVNGANAAEAKQTTGVVTVTGEIGATITLVFTNGSNTVTKTRPGTGLAEAVVLDDTDLGNLGNGMVTVSATQNVVGSVSASVTFALDTVAPIVPTLVLGVGVSNGASSAEAKQVGGVVTVTGEDAAAITVVFTNDATTVTKNLIGTGVAQAVVLTDADLVALGDGSISVSATQTDAAGNPQTTSAATTAFTLDTVTPGAPTLVLGTGIVGGATAAEATQAGGVVTVGGENGAAIIVTFRRGAGTAVVKNLVGTGSLQAVALTNGDLTTLGNGLIAVSATQTDAAGNAQTAVAGVASFMLDTALPVAPVLALGLGVATGATAAEAKQAGGVVTVTGENGATISVVFANGANSVTKNVSGTGSARAVSLVDADLVTLGDGTITVTATQTDGAGNAQVAAAAVTSFVLDTVVTQPTAALFEDTGSSASDGITRNGRVNVQIEAGATWRYSRNSGATWTTGLGTFFTLAPGVYPLNAIWVENADKAGNTAVVKMSAITVDQTAPTSLTVALHEDTGAKNGVTANGRMNVGRIEADAKWEYSTNSGVNWTTGSGAFFTLPDGLYGASAVRVRQTDRAGNVGVSTAYSSAFTIDTTTPTVTSVTSSLANGVYGFSSNTKIPIRVTFSRPVIVTGTPVLQLNTSPFQNAVYTLGSGSNTLTFTYAIQAGDSSPDLGYGAITSLTGGTIVNGAGTIANLTLPEPGAATSLDGSKAIVINTVISATAQVGATPLSTNSASPTITNPPQRITLAFNTDVSGVNLANMRLFRNGVSVPFGTATITRVNARTYWLSLPTSLTNSAGDYRLELGGDSTSIIGGIRRMTAVSAFYWRQS